MSIKDWFKAKELLIMERQDMKWHIQRLKDVKDMYERREDDIRSLTRENEELRSMLTSANNKVIQLQEDKINYLQNQRDFEESNEELEEKVEVLKDVIKGSKTIGTAKKQLEKINEVD